MTSNKFTDEEIISLLEVISTTRNCNECKIRNCKWGTCNCSQITASAALDLISRQKEEIKRLQKEANLVSIQFQDLQERTDEIKLEAYKKFAERLKRSTVTAIIGNKIYAVATSKGVDNLLKEMIGEEE